MLITIKEYAAKYGKEISTVRYKCGRGGYKTAVKMGRDWFIDPDEDYKDLRIRSGKYVKKELGK